MSYETQPRAYEIDFVVDCGADPTGVADCGPAWTTAMGLVSTLAADNLTLAYSPAGYKKAMTVLVPPGKYRFDNAATINQTFNFLNKVSYLTIRGFPSSSIFQFDAGAGAVFTTLANMQHLTVEGMVFAGLRQADTNSELLAVFDMIAGLGIEFDQCLFANLSCDRFLVRSESRVEFRHCTIANSCGKVEGLIVGLNAVSVILRDSQITDNSATLNGVPWPIGKTGPNTNSINATGTGIEYVAVIDSLIDEGCTRNVRIGAAVSGARLLEIRGSILNPAGHLGGAVIQAINVDQVLVDGVSQFTPAAAFTIPYLDLQNVRNADIRALMVSVGATFAPFLVQSDAASGVVKVSDPVNWNEAQIGNGAQTVLLEERGVLCDVLTAAAAIAIAGQLVKMAAAGTVTPLVVADVGNVAIVRGPALRAAAPGAQVAVVRTSQPVTMLSDGAGPIAVNARVTPSGVGAGRIVANGVATDSQLGIALTAALAVADAPVTVLWVPGNMGIA